MSKGKSQTQTAVFFCVEHGLTGEITAEHLAGRKGQGLLPGRDSVYTEAQTVNGLGRGTTGYSRHMLCRHKGSIVLWGDFSFLFPEAGYHCVTALAVLELVL